MILPTGSGHYSAWLSGQVCQSNGGEGVAKRIRSTRWDPEPISWENFLTSNGQFQVEVVWTRYLRCKSSQLMIPSPCDREASWWVAHPCGLTWGGCYWHRRLTFIVYHGREKVGNLVCLSSWYDSQRERSRRRRRLAIYGSRHWKQCLL